MHRIDEEKGVCLLSDHREHSCVKMSKLGFLSDWREWASAKLTLGGRDWREFGL